MKVVISEDTNKFYGDQIKALDSSIEIFSLNPEDPKSPPWAEVPECDAFFCLINFYLLSGITKSYLSQCWIYAKK